ncbi:hypothetical protein C0992_012345 [Termitomyces sp. T32_za158]|nr:hypothetical protein C0992_012345 [Termitomyces sp. T32_za158]
MSTDDSLTESDSISRAPDASQQGGYCVALNDGDIRDEDLCAKALHAIDQIRFYDIAAVERDDTLHEVILAAANTLLHLLGCVCLPPTEWCMPVALYLFPHLGQSTESQEEKHLNHPKANARFLSILFLHRNACRVVAAQDDASTAVVVCWVDLVLAKLATFIFLVAAGLVPHFSTLNDSNLLRSQREDDSVHAATQLPERWESLIEVVGSDTASPAAIRLATRLLFAALVMAPQLNDEKQWADLWYALPLS